MGNAPSVTIVGAGPGGLTAGMLLAKRGFKVTLLEKEPVVGGRNAALSIGPYTFDIGPTFLMMKFILDQAFLEAGRNSADYLEFKRLEPMYRLKFRDFSLEPGTDGNLTASQIERNFPGEGRNLRKFIEKETIRFRRMYPCLQKDYSSIMTMAHPDLLKALPQLALTRTLFSVLGDYFRDERLRIAFTFQSKYLGMSPWTCPGAFAILSFIEHAYGVYHVMGGLSEISAAMAKVVAEHGGIIRTSTPVKQVLLDGRRAVGVELASGERALSDEVVVNADFGHAMTSLFPQDKLRKYRADKLARRPLSCSTFMLYLGLDKIYETPHHAIFFADDYRENLLDISERGRLSEDFSFYVRNASVTDSRLAPPGHSAVYVLVPVPNLRGRVDWKAERARFREKVIEAMERKAAMRDLRKHIVAERVTTPSDWESAHSVYSGAVFNLAHTLSQMLYLRPRNQFEEFGNCYLVGGGTHPGSGLPTIYESGRITAALISKKHRIPFEYRKAEI